ncbi:MAG TPA: YHS domain-containing protein, partial [Acinetobacter sp.]|nr:YHS domain-containing protein [Acinetobacter sp.]
MSEQHKTSCCSKQKLAPTVVNIDPVCGMTVAEDSPHVYEHQSVRYLFCCSGCLKKFAANPEAYLSSEKKSS